jgi:hypothetical protein
MMAGEGEMVIETKSLGERIVEAARLAVAVHLFESLSDSSSHYGSQYGRRIGIGGAGPYVPGAAEGRGVEPFGRTHLRAGVPATDGDPTHAAPPLADDGEAGPK